MDNRPKVLVSGCFDLIHNGHVQFLKEASEYGNVFVRIGSDENIVKLKHHKPLFSTEERCFMLSAIKHVYDVAVSAGSGIFDFATDMEIIKPDFYFVNCDASEIPKRRIIADKLGVKMIVHPRKAPESLAARSSTSIKARIEEIVKTEQRSQKRANCNASASGDPEVFPWRLCLAGGWLDLGWCNKYTDCSIVITINIKYNPRISDDRCGLATSSRKHAMKAWNGSIPEHLGAEDAALYLYGLENADYFAKRDTPYAAGSQDHCGLFFPGINALIYDNRTQGEYSQGTSWPASIINLNDVSDLKQNSIFRWLENVLHIVRVPFVSRPSDYDSQRINRLKNHDIDVDRKKLIVSSLSAASKRAWMAIINKDADKLGRALDDTMNAWQEALPYTVNPYISLEGFPGDAELSSKLQAFRKKYSYPATKGCLFTGAGGGYLMVVSDAPVPESITIKINHDHIVKPLRSDTMLTARDKWSKAFGDTD